ncbi:MAG: long-chain fatty acid--CoA ligase [Candidatus Magnetomorum sp.]|nr:long-chain fatty acid--CoA ligase [Candidatus Magnetomorum sp.]
MGVEYLTERLKKFSDNEAIIYNDIIFLYKDILLLIDKWSENLSNNTIPSGSVVSITGDYSPDSIALIIALIKNKNIIVPLTPLAEANFDQYFNISHTQYIINFTENNFNVVKRNDTPLQNTILKQLIQEKHPGLILFTSGSTGEPKAVAHDFDRLLSKFIKADKPFRTLCFLMFDHIAGIDTYFYALYSGGSVAFPISRTPGDVCKLIEKYKLEVLPTSPTFLNLMMLSKQYKNYDLSSLKIITYGSEKMPGPLLKKVEETFKHVRIIQKYGLTELGSPSSRSKKNDSAWIKVNGDTFKTKVVDNILYVKSNTAMSGYLNAPSPFTDDGWFITGDSVEVDGEYIKILGRKSEIINLGGEKVWPVEIEEVIQMMPEVEDVVVKGIPSPITGQMIMATVKLKKNESLSNFRKKMRKFCKDKLLHFQIPQKVVLTDEPFHIGRFKKMR